MGYPLLGHNALSFLYIMAFDFAEIPKFCLEFYISVCESKESAFNAGELGLIPGLGRSPG